MTKVRPSFILTFVLLCYARPVSAQYGFYLFPQVADGSFPDGTYYRSSPTIVNEDFHLSPNVCTWHLYGLSVDLAQGFGGEFRITISSGLLQQINGWFYGRSSGNQPYRGGYATLTCDSGVRTFLTYTYYNAQAQKISEA